MAQRDANGTALIFVSRHACDGHDLLLAWHAVMAIVLLAAEFSTREEILGSAGQLQLAAFFDQDDDVVVVEQSPRPRIVDTN